MRDKNRLEGEKTEAWYSTLAGVFVDVGVLVLGGVGVVVSLLFYFDGDRGVEALRCQTNFQSLVSRKNGLL